MLQEVCAPSSRRKQRRVEEVCAPGGLCSILMEEADSGGEEVCAPSSWRRSELHLKTTVNWNRSSPDYQIVRQKPTDFIVVLYETQGGYVAIFRFVHVLICPCCERR